MREREAWTYLQSGNVVSWHGDLYFVMSVSYHHIEEHKSKEGVVLAPLNFSGSRTHVSHKWPPDQEEPIMDEFDDEQVGTRTIPVARLDGIVLVARTVEELIMKRLKKLLFSA